MNVLWELSKKVLRCRPTQLETRPLASLPRGTGGSCRVWRPASCTACLPPPLFVRVLRRIASLRSCGWRVAWRIRPCGSGGSSWRRGGGGRTPLPAKGWGKWAFWDLLNVWNLSRNKKTFFILVITSATKADAGIAVTTTATEASSWTTKVTLGLLSVSLTMALSMCSVLPPSPTLSPPGSE